MINAASSFPVFSVLLDREGFLLDLVSNLAQPAQVGALQHLAKKGFLLDP